MRFRTLALALALSVGATGLVQAAPKNTAAPKAKRVKSKKSKAGKHAKQAKAPHAKAPKSKAVKHASR